MSPPLVELGESLAELMHDLRGPLTTIAGWADLMSVEEDPARRREMFHEIRRQVGQLARMSAQTLAYARGEAPVLKRQVHLYAFARTLERHLAEEFCGTGITPCVDARYQGPAHIDPLALLRAIDNVAHNAHEALDGGRGSHFGVRIDAREGQLVLELCDDGPGVDAEIRDRLFSPFATHGKKTGTGLGLAAVKRIAEDHGGSVEFHLNNPGTCITMHLPLSGPSEAPEEEP